MDADKNLNYVVQDARKTLINEMVGKVELWEEDYLFFLERVEEAIKDAGYVITSYDIKYQDEGWIFPQVIPEMEGLSGALQLMNMLLYLIWIENKDDLFNLVV